MSQMYTSPNESSPRSQNPFWLKKSQVSRHKRHGSELLIHSKQNNIFEPRRSFQKTLFNDSFENDQRQSIDSLNRLQFQKNSKQNVKNKQAIVKSITSESELEQDGHKKQKINLKKKDNTGQKITKVFNQISDLTDKHQIHEAIKHLENREQRCILIDKILKRKQEKRDADQILQISKVQPLVNRFMRKIKKDSCELDQQVVQKLNKDQQVSKLTSLDNQCRKITSSQKFTKNEENINSIQGTSQTVQEKEGQQEENDENNKSRDSNIDMKTSIGSNKKGEPSLGSKVLFLSIFSGGGKKKEDTSNMSRISQISAYNDQFQKISSTGKKINLNKVSENSMELINKGKEQAKKKVNELLKDVQKQSLAAHFKSFSIKNRFDKKSQLNHGKDINTFNTDIAEYFMKKEQEKMNNYINYQNQIEAARVVSHEVVKYIDKYQKVHDDFIIYPKTITEPQARSIENEVQKTCQQQDLELSKRQRTISRKDYYPSKWRNQGNGKSFANLQRQATLSNFFGNYKLNTSRSYFEDIPQLTSKSRSKMTQNELIDDYRERKQQTLIRSRSKSPTSLIKSFLSPRSINSANSPYELFTVDTIMTTKTQRNNTSYSPQRSFIKNSTENYASQRERVGYQKKQYFSYNNEFDFLFDKPNNVNKEEKDVLELNNEANTKPIKEDFMRTFEKNKHINQKIKHIKTVNKWKLDGSIHFTGDDQKQNLNDSVKDDDSLVSFTEIKLDKLYKKTLNIQSQQRFLERIQSNNSQLLRRFQKGIYEQTTEKHKNNLVQVKNDVLNTTQYKLKQGRKFSLRYS